MSQQPPTLTPDTPKTETHAEATTGHEYDGIQEFDNPTPAWWTYIFILSMIFAVAYMMYYHGGNLYNGVEAEYSMDVATNNRVKYAAVGDLQMDEATLLMVLQEPSFLEMGRSVFRGNCVSCHGEDGGGGIGPNMHDDAYINVKEAGDILTVINEGAGDGRMPEWQGRLEQNDIVLVAGYVASLRGTPTAMPKAAEGDVIPPWPTAKPATP